MANAKGTRKQTALPERIYVKREANRDDPANTWLVASESLDAMENGEAIGVYELREIGTLQVTRALK